MMIRHIVMWKFREGEEKRSKEFLDGLRALYGVIPQIRALEVQERANKKNEYNAVLIADFDSLADLEIYKNDPRHLAVAALCSAIRESRAALDYEL